MPKPAKCSVTGLPITEKPGWTDIRIADDLVVSFAIVGERVLRTTLCGNASHLTAQSLDAHRRALLGKCHLRTRFVEIVDCAKAYGASRWRLRRVLSRYRDIAPERLIAMVAEALPKPLLALGWLSRWWPSRAGALEIRPDYTAAVTCAQALLAKLDAAATPSAEHIVSLPTWRVALDGCRFHVEIIDRATVKVEAQGIRFQRAHVRRLLRILEQIFDTDGLVESPCFAVFDFAAVDQCTWEARYALHHGLSLLYHRLTVRPRAVYICGPRREVETSLGITHFLAKIPHRWVSARNDALAEIAARRISATKTDDGPAPAPPRLRWDRHTIAREVEQLISRAGRLFWSRAAGSTIARNVEDGHPFARLYQLVSLAQESITTINDQQQRSLESLEKRLRLEQLITRCSSKLVVQHHADEASVVRYILSIIGEAFACRHAVTIVGPPSSGDQAIPPDWTRAVSFREGRCFIWHGLDDPTLPWCDADRCLHEVVQLTRLGKEGPMPWCGSISDMQGRVAELPDPCTALRRELIKRHAGAAAILPMTVSGKPFGVLIITATDEDTIWEEDDLVALRIVGDMLAQFLLARETERELKHVHEDLENKVRKRTEELTRARDEAQAASIAKSDFLANMSHEIRTPLNSVIGFAEILAGALEQDGPREPLQEHVDRILNESNRLLGLINDILDMAKVESGKLTLERKDFHLHHMIDKVTSGIRLQAESKGVHYHYHIFPGVPDWIEGDELRLGQIVINLLGNAVKFTDEGDVRFDVQLLAENETHVRLRFLVVDTGIGIPPDRLAGIFAKFEQADSSTTRRFGGTGLGMAIANELVHLMGGEIEARSEPGHGSAFWFDVWLSKGQPTDCDDGNRAAEAMDSMRGKRILVAEDYEPNQFIAMQHLAALGCTVDVAEDGGRAVELFRASHYDLVLMDVQMPVLDGYRATEVIKELRPECPVIGLTANVYAEARRKCLDSGMDAVLHKPLRRRDLLRAVEQQLRVRTLCGAEAPPAGTLRRLEEDPRIVPHAVAPLDDSSDFSELTAATGLSSETPSTDREALAAAWLEQPARDACLDSDAAADPSESDATTVVLHAAAPVDFSDLVDDTGGDTDAASQLVAMMLRALDGQLPAMRQSLAQSDWKDLARECHKIKGGATTIAARPLSEAARSLESAALAGDPQAAGAAMKSLGDAVHALQTWLAHYQVNS